MRYTFTTEDKTKTVNIPDKEIQYLIDKYKLSKDEAIYTWLVDEDYITDPRVEELEQKAKKNKVSREARAIKTEKTERKTKEKKENPLKKALINAIFDGIETKVDTFNAKDCHFTVRNDEKYIDLIIDGREFTINLIEHRSKK